MRVTKTDLNPSGDLDIDLLAALRDHPTGLTVAGIAAAVSGIARDRKERDVETSLAWQRAHMPGAPAIRLYVWPEATTSSQIADRLASLIEGGRDAPWVIATNSDWLRRRDRNVWHLTAAGYIALLELTREEREHQEVMARIRDRAA